MGLDKKVEDTITLVKSRGYTLSQMAYTLLFMPRFNARRISHLDDRDKVSYSLLAGTTSVPKRGVIHDLLRVVGELDWQRLTALKRGLAKEYIAQGLADGAILYLDGHVLKYLGVKKIPKCFSTTVHGVIPGIILFFLHDGTGAPLFFLTRPGDTHLTKVVEPAIAELDRILPGTKGDDDIPRTIVYDRGGVSGKIMTAIDRHEGALSKFICLTTNNKTVRKGIGRVKRFRPYRKLGHEDKLEDGRERFRISDARLVIPNFVPKDSPDGRTRCAVIHDRKREKKYAIVTNHVDKKAFPIASVADIYFLRWPRQENAFRDMKESVNLDIMVGYAARQVPNRVAKRKIERLLRSANNCTRMMNGCDKRIKALKKEIEGLKEDAGRIVPQGRGKRVFARIMRKIGALGERVRRERGRKGSYAQRKKALEEEARAVDPDKPLFDLETKKMDFMTTLRTFLTNCHRFIMKAMGKRYTVMTFNKAAATLYSHGGKIRLRDDDVLSIRFDPLGRKHQKAVMRMCQKLNDLKIKSPEGWTYNFGVKTYQF